MKTKELLSESFRELVLIMPLQKISIKMITDRANVIRPTFYNYFQDKYEVIEYLFDKDIGNKVNVMLENGMDQEAVKLMFICFEKNRQYYGNLFALSGQNSFEEYFGKFVKKTFLEILNRHPQKQMPSELLSPERMARFSALLLTEVLKLWLTDTPPISGEEMYEAYLLAMRTPVLDMIGYPAGEQKTPPREQP